MTLDSFDAVFLTLTFIVRGSSSTRPSRASCLKVNTPRNGGFSGISP